MVLIAVGTLLASALFVLWITPMSRWPLLGWAVSAGILPVGEQPPESTERIKPDPPADADSDADSDSDGASTPKATAQPSVSMPSVPAFTISDSGTNRSTSLAPKPAPAPAAYSLPMPPLPRPTPASAASAARKSAAELMPPPSVKASALRPLPKLGPGSGASSLMPPPSAASALRAPPGRGSQTLAPSTSTLPPSKRPSRKVELEPGHSPLDWAHLKRNPPTRTFLRGKDVPPERLIKVLPSEVKARNGRKGKEAWGVWKGKVYNLTPYLPFHPGGVGELVRGAGKLDAERLFNEVHPWVSWEGMLEECLIGVLVSEEEARAALNKLDEVD